MSAPQRLTTAQLRAMINQGSTRDELPASGSSVSSTQSSASAAYLAQIKRIQQTAAFRANQLQTERQRQEDITKQNSINITNNSQVMPDFIAQSEQWNRNSTNLPSALYPNQPVNITGQSESSVMVYGINTNANFNNATAMNDFVSANPTLDINAGYSSEPYFNYGQSSAPAANDVQTDIIGGDIQHIETDVNTNVEYEKPLSKQDESNVNWADKNIGTIGIAAAALGGALYFGAKN
tara:strand:+ start:798 stop:1508 length:711 start_codon:yes stop_codon:yes gene_type:complete